MADEAISTFINMGLLRRYAARNDVGVRIETAAENYNIGGCNSNTENYSPLMNFSTLWRASSSWY